jgi:hypothetical protein
MKKFLKRILAMTCLVTVLITPMTAFANTPSYYYEDPVMQYKYFEFATDPIILNYPQTGRLENNENNGCWFVSAGQSIFFFLNLAYTTDFRVQVVLAGSSLCVVDEIYYGTSGLSYDSLPMPVTGNYMIIIRPINSNGLIMDKFAVDFG